MLHSVKQTINQTTLPHHLACTVAQPPLGAYAPSGTFAPVRNQGPTLLEVVLVLCAGVAGSCPGASVGAAGDATLAARVLAALTARRRLRGSRLLGSAYAAVSVGVLAACMHR